MLNAAVQIMRMTRQRFGVWSVGRLVVLVGAVVFISSCERQSGAGSSAGAGRISRCTGGELFDCRYTYLVRGDEAFPTITTGFRIKTSPAEDETARLEVVSDPQHPVDGADSCRIFKITLKKEVPVLLVVADSIGSGMVAYEFGTLPPGQFTLGSGDFPPEMARWTKTCKRLVLFVSIDKFIRHRARWAVTPQGRLTHELNF